MSNLEDLIRRLPDVSACRIHSDESGAVVAAYVTATGGRTVTEIASDVVTLLVAEAGLDVDLSRIHVTMLPPEDSRFAMLEELEWEGRVRWLAVRTSVAEEETRVEVDLELAGMNATGQAAARGAGGAPELTALAVLDALERLCGGRVTLRLMSLQRLGDVTQASVQEADGRNARLHVGAARAEDPQRCAGYAALATLNRRIGRILAGSPKHYRIA